MSECKKSPRGRHVASFSGRCRYCGWVPPRRKSDAELLVLAERKIKSLTARLAAAEAAARAKLVAVLVWSLSCDEKMWCEAGVCEHATPEACAEYLVTEFYKREAAKGGNDAVP